MEVYERFEHENGHSFVIFKSSKPDWLNVSLTTGSKDFLGYVNTIQEGIELIESRFGPGIKLKGTDCGRKN